ncbi:MAG: S-methyl-5-thioribose-1-phosphate isomerase [Myxococcaceae bacterium]|nr:S-methyl-5-thioribose-1-phosphate isomerase [Myxococcaceae bacterium]
MRVEGVWRRSIAAGSDRRSVEVIDQRRLPHAFVLATLRSEGEVVEAIRSMMVRGAPLIGVSAAFGLAFALQQDPSDANLAQACARLIAARPTAVNLAWAVERVRALVQRLPPPARADAAFTEACALAEADVAACAAMGRNGLPLLEAARRAKKGNGPLQVLTHCNAGWLATVDHGTALSPIYAAHDAGLPVHVWVDETRPRNQGLLTAWELRQHGVPHTVVVDNAGGLLMQRGQVDLCIVGTDRTTARGDVCNKIGTYLKALAARASGVPFYVAAPSSSIDLRLDDGADIEIEERSGDEVRVVEGARLLPPDSPVFNPGFDVTPAALVTALVTEHGVCAAERGAIAKLLGAA